MSALVDYPSSDSEVDEEASSSNHPSDLPPLPSSFHTFYSTNTRISTSDDPSLHGGRKRQVPHTPGNWPTHIYLEWRPTPSETTSLQTLIALTTTHLPPSHTLHSLLQSDLCTPRPLHISLSRALQVPTAARDPLLARVTHAVRAAAAAPLLLLPPGGAFTAGVVGPRWVANHDATRWFLALGVARPGGDELNALLAACNAAVGECGFPALYREEDAVGGGEGGVVDRSEFFHFSLAWSLEDGAVTEELVESLWARPEVAAVRDIKVTFNEVFVKIGNKIHTIELGRKPT